MIALLSEWTSLYQSRYKESDKLQKQFENLFSNILHILLKHNKKIYDAATLVTIIENIA
jgi:hypothetical protein